MATVQITDKTHMEAFFDEDEEVPILLALGCATGEDVPRNIEVALIHAYMTGFNDGESVGRMD